MHTYVKGHIREILICANFQICRNYKTPHCSHVKIQILKKMLLLCCLLSWIQWNGVLKTTFTLQRTPSLGSFWCSLFCVFCEDLLMQCVICMRFHRTALVHRMKGFTNGFDGIGSVTLLLVPVTSCPHRMKAEIGLLVNTESSRTCHLPAAKTLKWIFFLFHDCQDFCGCNKFGDKKRMLNTDIAEYTQVCNGCATYFEYLDYKNNHGIFSASRNHLIAKLRAPYFAQTTFKVVQCTYVTHTKRRWGGGSGHVWLREPERAGCSLFSRVFIISFQQSENVLFEYPINQKNFQ